MGSYQGPKTTTIGYDKVLATADRYEQALRSDSINPRDYETYLERANHWRNAANTYGVGDTITITDATGDWRVVDDGRSQAAEMMALQSQMLAAQQSAMARQAELQESYNAQALALQTEQMRLQEESAALGNLESSKNASDYIPANPADTARKQMLARGLMSTYTRYGKKLGSSGGGAAQKADTLGG